VDAGSRRGTRPGPDFRLSGVRAARMVVMPPTAPPRPPGFSRRTLLVVSATGLAFVAAGCSSPPAEEREQVTSEQADLLSAQVAVQ
jgi:hypothetical protein